MNINTCYYFMIFKFCLLNGPRDKSFTGMPFGSIKTHKIIDEF